MSRSERVILTNMCMVSDGRGNVLMQNRLAADWPGLIFPGGYVEPGESFVASVIREVREETGITVKNPKLCGVKQFWLDDGVRYIILLFKADQYEGALQSSEEGEAMWVARSELPNDACSPDFDLILKVFENDAISEFYYEGNEAVYR